MATADAEHISVNEAFHLLLEARFQPHAARHRLEEALLTNEAQLWANGPDCGSNGTVVEVNFIASHLRVAAQTDRNGRWTACIEATRALDHPTAEYTWEMSRAEVEGLVPEPATTEDAQRDGPQLRRVETVMHELYRPDGKVPDSVKTNVINKAVGDEFKKRGWGTVSRDTIEFYTKRGRYKT